MREALAALPCVEQIEVEFGAKVLCELGQSVHDVEDSAAAKIGRRNIGYSKTVCAEDKLAGEVSNGINAVSPARDALVRLERDVSASERLNKEGAVADAELRDIKKLLAEAKIQLAVVADRPEDVVDLLRLLVTYHDADVRQAHRLHSKSAMAADEFNDIERAAAEVRVWLASAENNTDDLLRSLFAIVTLDEKAVARYVPLAAKGLAYNKKLARLQLQLSWSRYRLKKAQSSTVTAGQVETTRAGYSARRAKSLPPFRFQGSHARPASN